MTREQAAVAWAEAHRLHQISDSAKSPDSERLWLAEMAAMKQYLAVRDQPEQVTPEKRLAEAVDLVETSRMEICPQSMLEWAGRLRAANNEHTAALAAYRAAKGAKDGK